MSKADPRAVALFRYGLIAEFVHLPANSPGLYARLQDKAQGAYSIPGSTRTRVAAETLRDWLKSYRRGGFDALLPKPRTDRGHSRALPPAIADRLLELKEAMPALDPAAHPPSLRARHRPRVPAAAARHRAPPVQPRRVDAQARSR